MSKEYRARKRRIGTQTVHRNRHVHTLDDVIPIEQLAEEVSA